MGLPRARSPGKPRRKTLPETVIRGHRHDGLQPLRPAHHVIEHALLHVDHVQTPLHIEPLHHLHHPNTGAGPDFSVGKTARGEVVAFRALGATATTPSPTQPLPATKPSSHVETVAVLTAAERSQMTQVPDRYCRGIEFAVGHRIGCGTGSGDLVAVGNCLQALGILVHAILITAFVP